MNIFTISQLLNHNNPTFYYDTTSNNIKLSTVPILTMIGNNSLDISITNPLHNKPNNTVYKKTNNTLYKKTNNNTLYKNTNNTLNYANKKRNNIVYSDELRCCANTNDGNRCSLRRYTQKSKNLCYIHYKQQLKFTIKDDQIDQEQIPIPKSNKWYSWFKK